MVRMPKCCGPTAWTRAVTRPLGFCTKNCFRTPCGRERERTVMADYLLRERKRQTVPLLSKVVRTEKKQFSCLLTPIPSMARSWGFHNGLRMRSVGQCSFEFHVCLHQNYVEAVGLTPKLEAVSLYPQGRQSLPRRGSTTKHRVAAAGNPGSGVTTDINPEGVGQDPGLYPVSVQPFQGRASC